MIKRARDSIRVIGLNPRASTDTQSLFASLEAFANLGDSFEEYQAFTTAHPTFWPVELCTNENQPLCWVCSQDFHVLTIAFRDYLRHVWRGDQHIHNLTGVQPGARYGRVLKMLLGLEMQILDEGSAQRLEAAIKERTQFEVDPYFGAPLVADYNYVVSLDLLRKQHPDWELAVPVIDADWTCGEWRYEPLNDFQRAVYALWRESWRARTCPECTRLFIAAKPPQLYCGVACSNVARRKRDLAFWRAKGDARRRKRRGVSGRKNGGK